MEDELAIQITGRELQAALHLTDEDVQRLRELEGTRNIEPGGLVPSALPIADEVRLVIGNSISLES
jgi:hypothetical protein